MRALPMRWIVAIRGTPSCEIVQLVHHVKRWKPVILDGEETESSSPGSRMPPRFRVLGRIGVRWREWG